MSLSRPSWPALPALMPSGRPEIAALAMGLLLALAVAAALLGQVLYARSEVVQHERERNELLARVLEDHATRSIEAVSLATATLSDLISRGVPVNGAAIDAAIGQTLVNLPFLRSLSALDAKGRIVASSDPQEVGGLFDLRTLGPLPVPGRDQVGAYLPGRRLMDAMGGTAAVAPPDGVGFIPLVRTVLGTGGERVHLVALLNPEALSNVHQLMLNDPQAVSALVTYQGRLLTATAASGLTVGQDLSGTPPFARFLPKEEHASYIGAGMRAGEQIVAFRVLRTRPLLVLVEKPLQVELDAWMQQARWFIAAGLAGVLFIVAMTGMAVRSLRAREVARAALDASQAEVAERERELSVIFRSVQELLFRTDATGTITFINARWLMASGRPASDAIGQRLQDLVTPDSQQAVAALFAMDDEARSRQVQARLHAADGQLRRFEVSVVPIAAHGQTVGYAGSAVDVTDIHATQAELQAQLAFTASLIETNPLPISVHDMRGRYLRVNRAWEAFTGMRREDVIGQRASAHLPAEQRVTHEAQDRALLERGGDLHYESRYTHRDGGLHDLFFTKSMVPGRDGRPVGIVTAFMDISEIREAERATREARDAAESASRAKSEFIANISHELRTPLQSILGFSELGMLRGRPHPALAAMFDDIYRAGQRMLALVNDLLDVSKIENAIGGMDLRRVDLTRLVRDVARELGPQVSKGQVQLSVQLPDEPVIAMVDPARFQQVVRNVLANAIKFSVAGQAVEVTGCREGSTLVHIEIADRGPGIPPAELEAIFEAFVQSSKTKDGAGGTGLGLAICRKIMQAHGGQIQALNREGGGSCFRMTLSCLESAELAAMMQPERPPA